MLERIIKFSIRQRWLIVIATAVIAVLGIYNYQRLTIDAVPDITSSRSTPKSRFRLATGFPGAANSNN